MTTNEELNNTEWINAKVIGYEPITELWQEFTNIENDDMQIKELYKKSFNAYQADYKKVTELALVLNHKSIYWISKNEAKSNLYNELYYNLIGYEELFLPENELEYFNSWIAPNDKKI